MKIRDVRGGTLGLIAVVTLAIAILGFAFFFFSKFLGGNRELQMASDAGAINTAKQAAVRITVDVNNLGFGLPPAPEFAGLGDPIQGDPDSVNRISLATYNRAAAKALLVALNARSEGTAAATASANTVLEQLRNLGNALRQRLAAGGQVNSFFDDLAGPNNIRLVALGGRTQLIGNVSTAFMRPGGRANISFRLEPRPRVGEVLSPQDRQAQLDNTLPLGITMADIAPFEAGSSQRSSDNRRTFIGGYRSYNVPPRSNYGGTNGIVFLPTFPGDRPHLVSLAEFNDSRTSPEGYSPPNAFGGDAQAREVRTNLFERVLSRAIIGVLGREDTVSIPRGYIRFVNLPGALPSQIPPFEDIDTDLGNILANNELWEAPGEPQAQGPILISTNSGVFTTGTSAGADLLVRFAAYNESEGQDALGHDPNRDPLRNLVQGGTPRLFQTQPNGPIRPLRLQDAPFGETLRFGDGPRQLATVSQVLRVRLPIQRCNTNNVTVPACAQNLGIFAGNYERGLSPGGGIAPNGFTALEVFKARVIQRARRFYPNMTGGEVRICETIWADPALVTGQKVYDRGINYACTPGDTDIRRVPVNFGVNGTIAQLLFFSGGCSFAAGGPPPILAEPRSNLGQMEQRIREFRPGTTRPEVLEVLNSSDAILPLGRNGRPEVRYLFVRGPGQPLTIAPTLPREWGIRDDVNMADGDIQSCEEPVQVLRTQVNSAPGNGAEFGDCRTHIAPFMRLEAPRSDPTTIDTSIWRPSSGRGNLLGECRFQNRATGGGQFCGIN